MPQRTVALALKHAIHFQQWLSCIGHLLAYVHSHVPICVRLTPVVHGDSLAPTRHPAVHPQVLHAVHVYKSYCAVVPPVGKPALASLRLSTVRHVDLLMGDDGWTQEHVAHVLGALPDTVDSVRVWAGPFRATLSLGKDHRGQVGEQGSRWVARKADWKDGMGDMERCCLVALAWWVLLVQRCCWTAANTPV